MRYLATLISAISFLLSFPASIFAQKSPPELEVFAEGDGTDIVLQRHLAVRLELRDYLAAQPSPITGTVQDVVPSAGVVYRFK